MFLGQMWEELAPQIFDLLGDTPAHPGRGETLEIRRPNSLTSVKGLGAPARPVLAAPAAAGATAVTLRLADSSRMQGRLIAGTALVIGGATYRTTATVAVVTPPGTSIGPLPITPALAAPAAEGEVADVSAEANALFPHCHLRKARREDVTRDLDENLLAVASVPTKDAPFTPEVSMSAKLEDGTVARIVAVPASAPGFWTLHLGAS